MVVLFHFQVGIRERNVSMQYGRIVLVLLLDMEAQYMLK